MQAALWLCIGLFGGCIEGGQRSSLSQPNIVLIFVDDMGWGDVDCNAEAPGATGS